MRSSIGKFPQIIAAFVTLTASILATQQAHAQYVASILQLPTGAGVASLSDGYRNQQIGSYFLWNGSSGSIINLESGPYPTGAQLLGINGTAQTGSIIFNEVHHGGSGRGGGGAGITYYYHAALWHGSGQSLIDLNPTTASQSKVLGIYGTHEAGYAVDSTTGLESASLWNGTAGSAVNLGPTGFGITTATGINGSEEVGYGLPTGSSYYAALLWKGTAASAVNLAPASLPLCSSYALGVDGANNVQVGYVNGFTTSTTYISDAYLWRGTAASGVDLSPVGALTSAALAAGGGYQVGWEETSSLVKNAVVWKGTAASAINLQSTLPIQYSASAATGYDSSDGSITGYATMGGGTSAVTVPVVWRLATEKYVTVLQSPAADATGWTNQATTLTLTSPYTTGSITYSISGGASKKVTGTTVSIPLSTSGTFVVAYSAGDGAGHSTPTHQYTANVDLAKPTTTLSYNNFTITLTAQDPTSDPVTTYYELDGTTTPTTYTAPIVVPNINHTLVYWSVDSHGNTEAHHTATLPASAPTLTSVSPNTELSGSPDLLVAITGTGFNATSQALWNGSELTSAYISPTSLQATVPAADLAAATVASISVINPAPGAGSSGSVPFTVYQKATATGIGQNTGGSSFTLDPVSSFAGFTLQGSAVDIATSSTTVFLDWNGIQMTPTNFFDTVVDGQTIAVTGVYSSGTIDAWTVQMVTQPPAGGGS